MLRKLIAGWLLKGIKKDLETQAREVFKAALLEAFRDLESEDSAIGISEFSAEHGFAFTHCGLGDMTLAVRRVRNSIRRFADSTVNKHAERLGALRQSIPETVASEVIKESTIDTIIAKINSKQLKGGIPT